MGLPSPKLQAYIQSWIVVCVTQMYNLFIQFMCASFNIANAFSNKWKKEEDVVNAAAIAWFIVNDGIFDKSTKYSNEFIINAMALVSISQSGNSIELNPIGFSMRWIEQQLAEGRCTLNDTNCIRKYATLGASIRRGQETVHLHTNNKNRFISSTQWHLCYATVSSFFFKTL